MGELEREDTEERITADVTAKDSGMALTVEVAAAASEGDDGGEEKPPPPPESEENAMEVPEPPEKGKLLIYYLHT